MTQKRIVLLILLLAACAAIVRAQISNPDPGRFAREIQTFVAWDQKNNSPKDGIVFVGSSSIRRWATGSAFPNHPVINRGFGGSHISDVNFYYDQLVKPYDPSIVVFYAGDNDIGSGD